MSLAIRDRLRRCKACNELHWESEWPHNHVEPRPERSALPAPYFISDTMDALVNPVDSQMYDSKHQFRAATSAGGGIEVGTDPNPDKRWVDEITPADVAQATQMVEQGYRPQPLDATPDEMSAIIA